MSDIQDDAHDSIEEILRSRTLLTLPHGHRERVLSAVQDALASPRTSVVPSGPTMGGIAALTAMALSSGVALVIPWLVLAMALAPPSAPSIADIRARAAGIEVPPELAVTIRDDASGSPGDSTWPPLDRRHESWRIRRDLSGDL